MKETPWATDTCGCVFITGPAQESLISVVNRCRSHSHLSNTGLFNQVKSECRRKNYTFAEIEKVFENLDLSQVGELPPKVQELYATGQIKKARRYFLLFNYNWSFDAQRKLKVGILNLTVSAAERAQLQANCNAKFGAGKVEVI